MTRSFLPRSLRLALLFQASIMGSVAAYASRVYASPLLNRRNPILLSSTIRSRATTTTTRGNSPVQLLALTFPRGGGGIEAEIKNTVSSALSSISNLNRDPQSLFNGTLLGLALVIVIAKLVQRASSSSSSSSSSSITIQPTGEENITVVVKPKEIQSLQNRFLAVFWLLRCSDWLQGPYFYEVYASKIFHGVPASLGLVSRLFLTGFASTALFGPSVGRLADQYGRKKATLAFTVLYALGALTTKSSILQVLFLGRILSGIGTSLLFSAPESWLVGESQKVGQDPDGKYLSETFGRAYAGDSLVAILAGQMSTTAATMRGPSGPFELSTIFLAMGGLLTAVLWKENRAPTINNKKPSIAEAMQVIQKDPKIMLVGSVQSLFEAAMYIFVLQWPPALAGAVQGQFGVGAATPYGTIFSCFMACCLLGSTLFGQLAKHNSIRTEASAAGMLLVATLAMTAATLSLSPNVTTSLPAIVAAFFAFEACVGMYFPSIGTLRSRYVPDSHRSVIMNLFGIPLNVLVVGVFLSISKLGVQGALAISSGALGLATICMLVLQIKAIDNDNNNKVGA